MTKMTKHQILLATPILNALNLLQQEKVHGRDSIIIQNIVCELVFHEVVLDIAGAYADS